MYSRLLPILLKFYWYVDNHVSLDRESTLWEMSHAWQSLKYSQSSMSFFFVWLWPCGLMCSAFGRNKKIGKKKSMSDPCFLLMFLENTVYTKNLSGMSFFHRGMWYFLKLNWGKNKTVLLSIWGWIK